MVRPFNFPAYDSQSTIDYYLDHGVPASKGDFYKAHLEEGFSKSFTKQLNDAAKQSNDMTDPYEVASRQYNMTSYQATPLETFTGNGVEMAAQYFDIVLVIVFVFFLCANAIFSKKRKQHDAQILPIAKVSVQYAEAAEPFANPAHKHRPPLNPIQKLVLAITVPLALLAAAAGLMESLDASYYSVGLYAVDKVWWVWLLYFVLVAWFEVKLWQSPVQHYN